MNLRQRFNILDGKPAEYRWTCMYIGDPDKEFIVQQGGPYYTLASAYLSQVGFSWHSSYEQVLYVRRECGEVLWWELTNNDIIFIMHHEKETVEL